MNRAQLLTLLLSMMRTVINVRLNHKMLRIDTAFHFTAMVNVLLRTNWPVKSHCRHDPTGHHCTITRNPY